MRKNCTKIPFMRKHCHLSCAVLDKDHMHDNDLKHSSEHTWKSN